MRSSVANYGILLCTTEVQGTTSVVSYRRPIDWVKTATGTRTQKEGIVEGPEIQFSEVEIDNGIHGKRHVRFETGRLAKQAAGSVLVTIDDETTLLSATAIGKSPREGFDFFPLTVDVEERMYAAGKIPGSFFRREGRPPTEAIL